MANKVVTMNVLNKKIRIGQRAIFDTELMRGLRASREIRTEDMFQYKLSPVPSSVFDSDGEIRTATNKSDLKRKLQSETSSRLVQTLKVVVIDGCALIWSII